MNRIQKYALFACLFVLIISVLACFLILKNEQKTEDASSPLVSVIISSFNMADTLPESIDSILKQTYQNFEIIVVDDGSVDNTDEVLKKYKNNPKVRILKNVLNIGLPMSLNRGILAARGKYIARLDADDTSYPDRLERQVKYMEKHGTDLLGGYFDSQIKKYPKHPDINSSQYLGFSLMRANVFGHSTIMMRKSFLNKHVLFYSPFRPNAEDYDLWTRIFVKRGKLALLGKEPIVMHHQSHHSKKWWDTCHKSAEISRRNALKKIIPNADNDIVDLPHCMLLPKYIEANPKTKYFNQEMLQDMYDTECVKN